MEKSLYLVVAGTVLIFTALAVVAMFQSSIGDSSEDIDSMEESTLCEYQASQWEPGDMIDTECIDYLPESQQESVEKNTICEAVCIEE